MQLQNQELDTLSTECLSRESNTQQITLNYNRIRDLDQQDHSSILSKRVGILALERNRKLYIY